MPVRAASNVESVDSLQVDPTGLIAAAETCQQLAADLALPHVGFKGTTPTASAAQLVYATVLDTHHDFANRLGQQSEVLSAAAAIYERSDSHSAAPIARAL